MMSATLAFSLLATFASQGVREPVFSSFTGDVPGQPPAVGGASHPSSVVVPPGGYIRVQGVSSGLSCKPVELFDDDGQAVAVLWDYSPVRNGVVRMEATVSLASRTRARLLDVRGATAQGGLGVFARVVVDAVGNVRAGSQSGPIIGGYVARSPFGVRIDCDVDRWLYSVAVDNELDGYADDPSVGEIPQFVSYSLVELCGFQTVYHQVPGEFAAPAAYDDILIASASVDRFGSGTPGTGGCVPLIAVAGGPISAANPGLSIQLEGAPPGSIAWLWASPLSQREPGSLSTSIGGAALATGPGRLLYLASGWDWWDLYFLAQSPSALALAAIGPGVAVDATGRASIALSDATLSSAYPGYELMWLVGDDGGTCNLTASIVATAMVEVTCLMAVAYGVPGAATVCSAVGATAALSVAIEEYLDDKISCFSASRGLAIRLH